MHSIFEIKKFNQKEDEDAMFDDSFETVICTSRLEVSKYVLDSPIYGRVYEYDENEYKEFYGSSDYEAAYLEVPEPINIYETSDFELQQEEINYIEISALETVFYNSPQFNNIKKKTGIDGYKLYKIIQKQAILIKDYKRAGQVVTFLKKQNIDLAHNNLEEFGIVVNIYDKENKKMLFNIQAFIQANCDNKFKENSRY